MANTPRQRQPPSDSDPLAAVLLHVLVSEARDGLTAFRLAEACERDPRDAADLDEVEAALGVLLNDGLAQSQGDLYKPTRAAIRASELSF